MPTNKKNKTVLVTGATGRQGGAVLRQLRQRGFPVRALTRDVSRPEVRALTGPGVEVFQGDMGDPNSLTSAMDGVFGVYSVQNWHQAGMDGEVRQGINLAEAARRSGVTHFVYSSVASVDQHTGIPHFETKARVEEHIRSSGLRYTFVRPAFFMENWLSMRPAIENGAISMPLDPDKRLQMIAVEDIGGVVAMAFEHPGKWQDRTIELAGDELSMAEVAQVFTRASGHEVRYVQVPWDEFEKQAGKEYAQMFRWFQDTGYHIDIGAVRQEYHSLMTFEQWINSSWHRSTQTAR